MIHEFSRVGKHHTDIGLEKQDYICHYEDEQYICIVLADGVSTCAKSGEGARIAGSALLNMLSLRASLLFEMDDDKVRDYTLKHVVYELNKEADANGDDLALYSSTLAACLYDKKEERYLVFSLGDSMVMAVGYGRTNLLGKPDDSTSGCPVTTISDAPKYTNIIRGEGNYEMFMVLSDGAWHEMFDRNRIKDEVAGMLNECDIDALKKYLEDQDPFDDYSFIAAGIG